MTKRLLPSGLALVLLAASALPLRAQYVYFSLPDTIFTIPIGATGTLPLFVGNNCGTGIASYNVTLFFDAPRVSVTAVDTVPGYSGPVPTLDTSVPGQATISASGGTVSYCPMGLAEVTFSLADTAGAGTLVSMRINALNDLTGGNLLPSHTTELLDVWQAINLWGDVDSSFTVTSRDALIALTAAVGLPTTGYDIAVGDVDADGQVTSRDALFMLSYAVGYTSGYGRTGVPIPNHGAPLYPAPNDFAFFRGSTVETVLAGDTTVTPVVTQSNFYPTYGTKWSPDGSTLLATMYTSTYYYEVVAIDVATGTIDSALTANSGLDIGGVFSPDGSRVAFVSSRVTPTPVFTMPFSDGAAATAVTSNTNFPNFGLSSSGSGYSSLDWDSIAGGAGNSYIIFPADTLNGNWGLYAVNPDSFAANPAAEVFPNSQQKIVRYPVWKPTGDSVLFRSDSAGGRLYKVGAPTGATTTVLASYFYGTLDWPAWTSAGIWFRRSASRYPYGYNYYLQQPNGRIRRVLRGTNSDQGMGVRR